MENGGHSIFPADLLALAVVPARRGDGDLVEAAAELGQLDRHFGLEPEPPGFQADFLEHVPLEDLVAGLHVGQVEVGHHVAELGQDLVADVVPEEEDPVGPPLEAGAVNDVRPAVENGRQELGVFSGVVLKVGVLDEDDVPRGPGKSPPERRPPVTPATVS